MKQSTPPIFQVLENPAENRILTVGTVHDTGSDVVAEANLTFTGSIFTVTGSTQQTGSLTVGVNDAGHDVILYGDTASANVTWDASADDLILNGAARLVVPDGQLVLNATAVTSTAAELNLLDGLTAIDTDLASVSANDDTLASAKAIKTQLDTKQPTAADLTALSSCQTGAASAVAALTAAEVQILDGATVATADLNVLGSVARGQIIYGNAAGNAAVLSAGSNGQVLTSDGTDISWQAASGGGGGGVAANDLNLILHTQVFS
tara:strand:+ start:334 stop:1125 length:792 start_codon:yes stop_codon:yes gene_type:complete